VARPQAKAERQARRRAPRDIYAFGGGRKDGRADMKELLGGKGANLAEMARLGLPVPPGFTISTEVCTYYYAHRHTYPAALHARVEAALARVEQAVGRRFGDPENPLLVSVRSGARASMPGMMDTILNLGLNDRTVEGLVRQSGNRRFAYDSYRRFVQMYGDVVLDLKPQSKDEEDPFEIALAEKKRARGARQDTELDADALRELVEEFKALVKMRKGVLFPEDPQEQLWGAIGAVFRSWMNRRAITYRSIYRIPESWGTAVNVQAMVFGNLGEDCATGVAFTRDVASGEPGLTGEYLPNAQGEDVVAGIRTPLQITRRAAEAWAVQHDLPEERRRVERPSLEERMPAVFRELVRHAERLERHYRDVQDIEFTIERGRLWMLQTRTAKRTGIAAVRIAHDLVRARSIPPRTALLRVDPEQIDQWLHPAFDPRATRSLLARGLGASPGAAVGDVVFSADAAVRAAAEGRRVVLVRIETSPEDIGGMKAAQGFLTARGGMTSHAAIVARQMGKPCVAGCGALAIDYARQEMTVSRRDCAALRIAAGTPLSIDGASGEVYEGAVPLGPPPASRPEFGRFMRWADEVRRLGVRANADRPEEARVARSLGAEGIGLCRTEHMFFEGDRIDAVREMLLADDQEGRERALAKILPMQREDFVGILREMQGLPVTIRLLDPPLHEFLPHTDEELEELARKLGVAAGRLREKRDALHEANPMLGHRGCRLAITYPEIYRMQVRAIMEAATVLARERVKVLPEVMIPLVGTAAELRVLRADVEAVAREVIGAAGVKVPFTVGTMIEVPRAAITAGEIAAVADFFSFGTNDLTQMALGLSRDDAGRFLPEYVARSLFADDPFVVLDRDGVGELMRRAVAAGRKARRDLKLGICGEHGGEPASIRFCHEIGLDYVSCSPYRVPIARLAAAHAALGAR
jgi:pyruvate,orthophosphate dikinase